jgi:hypothetical protein
MKTPTKICGLWAVALLASALTASATTATYNVDMSVQIALGFFHTNTDSVFVEGDFSDPPWLNASTNSAMYNLAPTFPGGTLYTGTFTLMTNAPGSDENHLFVMNPGSNYTALVYEPNANFGAGGNRYFIVPAASVVNTNLPTVFFDDVTNVDELVTTPVTFYVDMSVQEALGAFNPATDFVAVAGDWGWAIPDITMTATGTNASVFYQTVSVTNIPGNLENYKFINLSESEGNIWEGVVGPGSGANGDRQFVFPSVATNLPTVFFNNQSNATVSVQINFQVNTIVANAMGLFSPPPAGAGYVTVSGGFGGNNYWNASANVLTQSPSNSNLWTGTVTLTGFVPGATVDYLYYLNGTVWETTGNKTFVVPSTASTNLPVDYFDNYVNLGTLSVSNNHAGQAIIKWPRSGTRIRLQSSGNLGGAWTDVANTLGSNTATVNISGQTMYRAKGP